MFELVFGIIWTAFTAFMTFMFYGIAGEITVNGVLTSHEEFITLLWPKLFFGIFWLVGIFLIVTGLRKLIRDGRTEKQGEICYGMVENVYPSGSYVNGQPLYKADVLVFIPSENREATISENIGFKSYDYPVQSFVKVKYFNNDINIKERLSLEKVPLDIKERFISNRTQPIENYQVTNTNITQGPTPDLIVVDGVTYKRVD